MPYRWIGDIEQSADGDTPILVLLGGLNTLKRGVWNLSMTDPFPSVSDHKLTSLFHVRNLINHWLIFSATNYALEEFGWLNAKL